MVGGEWVPLPKNNAHVVQTTVQRLNASLTKLNQVENAVVGKPSEVSNTLVGMLTFDGKEPAPVVPAKDLSRYPVLQNYPEIELAPATLQPSGVRQAPLFLIAPGYMAFGPVRIAAAVEQPAER